MNTYQTIRGLRDATPPYGVLAECMGYHEPHDGGGGMFLCVERSPLEQYPHDPDNGGTILRTSHPHRVWVRLFDGPVTPRMFGAHGAAALSLSGAMDAGSRHLQTGHFFGIANPIGWTVMVDGAGPEGAILHSTIEEISYKGRLTLADIAHANVQGVTQVMMGPDDTKAIQGAIDWSIYGAHQARVAGLQLPPGCPVGGECYIPPGTYLTTDTIWLGYGGPGGVYAGGKLRAARPGPGGVEILATKGDRLAIAVQGARQSTVEGLQLTGPNMGHLMTTGWIPPSIHDPSDASAWVSPSLPPSATGRYSIHAAIAIDPHSGPRPEQSYPDVTYPPWAGSVEPYNKGQSSGVIVQRCVIQGFVAGIANQPCDYDGNGDFTRIRDCTITRCVYPVSVGNTQSRNVEVSNTTASTFHTAITTGIVGRQNGKLGGIISNCSFGDGIQLIDCPNPSVAGPVTMLNCQSEGLWRLGKWGAGVGPKGPLTIRGGIFAFNHQSPEHGIPAELLEAGAPASVTLEDCALVNYQVAAIIGGDTPGLRLDNVRLVPMPQSLTPWEMRARTFLGGVMFTPSSGHSCRPAHCRIAPGEMHDPDTGQRIFVGQLDAVELSDGKRCLSAWSRQAAPISQPDQVVPIPRLWSALGKGSWDLDGLELTMTMPFEQSAWDAVLQGPNAGDVLWDSASCSIFFVHSREGQQVKATLQNNYRKVDGAVEYFRPITAYGHIYVGLSRLYMPSHYTQATSHADSPTLTDVGRGDGYGGYLPVDVRVGDYIWQNGQADGAWVHPANSRVVAVGSNSIDLHGQVRRSGSQRLSFFVRATGE